MQTLLVCLTILACVTATTDWSQYCNGNIIDAFIPPPSVQVYLQDQLVESQPTGREIVGWMQIKPTESSHFVRPAHSATHATYKSIPVSIVASAPKNSHNDGSKASVSKQSQGLNTKATVKNIDQNENSDESKIEASLPQISKMTILHHFDIDENDRLKGLPLKKFADQFVVKSEHKKNAGLFITLIKNGGTRACWGSVNSSQRNLVLATVYTTEDALAKDYRYSKIKKSEINQLIPQVTVVKKIIPINSIVTMQPLKQGLMVRAGGKGAVLLPGEASDPHYQLVKTKLKAGIPMSQPCQLYRIEADVYR